MSMTGIAGMNLCGLRGLYFFFSFSVCGLRISMMSSFSKDQVVLVFDIWATLLLPFQLWTGLFSFGFIIPSLASSTLKKLVVWTWTGQEAQKLKG